MPHMYPYAPFQPALLKIAFFNAFKKLAPQTQWRNPVMFVVYIGGILTTLLCIQALLGHGETTTKFIFHIALWLWLTVFFANFAEALAESHYKIQATCLYGEKIDGPKREKTPNERALTVLLVALTLIFLFVSVTLLPFSFFSIQATQLGSVVTITTLIALFVCLTPTTIGGLLSVVRIAAMNRVLSSRIIASSSHAVEAACDVDVLLLEKTGAVTLDNRLAQLPKMGLKPVIMMGDNHLTAAAIAAEAGIDDFLAEATPQTKLNLIRYYQAHGKLVAMTGDSTHDAPALAQADVAVAMNAWEQAAQETNNIMDLDANPNKLLEIVEIGKQMLMTRGSLTTLSVSNDIAKYFAMIPAALSSTYPQLARLNIMHLTNPSSAILSTVIFNALMILCCMPLALKGVRYRPASATKWLRRNLVIYGLGGIALPFFGIKLVDMILG